jgi:hypothetical protein
MIQKENDERIDDERQKNYAKSFLKYAEFEFTWRRNRQLTILIVISLADNNSFASLYNSPHQIRHNGDAQTANGYGKTLLRVTGPV